MREHLEALIAGWKNRASEQQTVRAITLRGCADDLQALLTADAGEWRNMDSAPRDGTFVLLWVPADERSEGYCEVGAWVRSAGHWDIGTAHQPDSMFTHWHAEPPPPQEPPR